MRFDIKNICTSVILLAGLSTCGRMVEFEPQTIAFEKTIVLGHGASGNFPDFRRNTLKASILGLDSLNGIEVDISISKDNGLWLTKDNKVRSIDKYFIDASDATIAGIKDENDSPYYQKLEDVMQHMSGLAEEKTISLDVKRPNVLFANSIYSDVANKINSLIIEFGLEGRVLVESSSVEFLENISEQKALIESYFLCYGNYEKGIATAYQNGLTGISFDYGRDDELTQESTALAHELGLKVLVYTINDDEIKPVLGLNVDIIETDNMDFFVIAKKK